MGGTAGSRACGSLISIRGRREWSIYRKYWLRSLRVLPRPAMTSKSVAFLLADLGVTKTHSRPHLLGVV
ncbi:MAG: hypothetical protein DMD96_33860 [Candidatus Rokuibacteriota bacterium]|nr:MAG: hypothetical protein DMD96_33860 [Candidatus Rokubacteria bacterium]